MSIEIPSELQPFVTEQVQLGLYQDEQHLVDEAVRLLKAERDEAVIGIRLGLADADANRMEPLNDAFQDLRREFGLGNVR
jgi:Arc/MetJ-type ribon-helix-helix transcriptional regulator